MSNEKKTLNSILEDYQSIEMTIIDNEGELNEILPFIVGIAGRMAAKAVIAKAAKRAQQKRTESKKMKKVKEKRAISFTNFRKSNDWDEITEKTEYDGISIKLNNPTKKE